MFLCPGPGAAKCRILCGQELIPGRAVLHVPPDRAEDLCCDPDECIHITVKELREDGTVRVGFADGREAWVASEAVSMNQAGTMRGRGGGSKSAAFILGRPAPKSVGDVVSSIVTALQHWVARPESDRSPLPKGI